MPDKKRYWSSEELIVIGTFAGLIKVSTMLIALAGGGMNPISLVLKNIVATTLLIVLVYKVRKFGVLSLYSVIISLVSLMLMGSNAMTFAGSLVAGVICDGLIFLTGGHQRTFSLVFGVAFFDFFSRFLSLGYSYFLYQEEFKLFVMGAVFVTLGYVGCLIGLGTGVLFAKELKHAGIIRQ
ncbi:MAG: MptD family putative ECF transporter S component [Desulfobacterium sp.]